jgi:hypothetical protein
VQYNGVFLSCHQEEKGDIKLKTPLEIIDVLNAGCDLAVVAGIEVDPKLIKMNLELIRGQLEKLVIPKIAEEKLRQLFRDNSDCFTKVSLAQNAAAECYVNEQALSEDGFVKLFKKLSNFSA